MEEKGSNLPQWQHMQYPSYDASGENLPKSYSWLNSSPEAQQQNVVPSAQLTEKTLSITQLDSIYNIKRDNATAQNYPEAITTGGWFENYEKNKPQLYSAGAACFIFITGGLNMAWSVNKYVPLQNSWFIGAVIGAVLGMIIHKYNKLQRKTIILCSAFMVILCGILFATLPDSDDVHIAARYINGIANGLVFAPTLTLIGEEAIKTNRGMIASSLEAFSFSAGIFLQLFLMDFEMARCFSEWYGIFQIFFGAIAFATCYFLFIESPIYLLMHNQEEEAIDSVRRLQRPFNITNETYEQLEEHKQYIAKNAEMTVEEAAIAGLPALLKLCLYRGLVGMCFVGNIQYQIGFYYDWAVYVFAALPCLGCFIAIFILDSVGRKKSMLLGAFGCSFMGIVAAGTFFADDEIAGYLLFIFQLFVGFFISSSSAYLTEAFPLAVKTYYISIVFIVEMFVKIIIYSSSLDDVYTFPQYYLVFGGIGLMFCLMGVAFMPETKRDTLLEAQVKFGPFIRTIPTTN